MTDDYSDYDMDEQYELAYAAGRASRNDEIAQLKAENKRLREALNGGWVSFDVAQPEGPNLVQQYLGDSVLDQQDPPFWAFPTSRWHGTKHLYATHWRYIDGPMNEQKP